MILQTVGTAVSKQAEDSRRGRELLLDGSSIKSHNKEEEKEEKEEEVERTSGEQTHLPNLNTGGKGRFTG